MAQYNIDIEWNENGTGLLVRTPYSETFNRQVLQLDAGFQCGAWNVPYSYRNELYTLLHKVFGWQIGPQDGISIVICGNRLQDQYFYEKIGLPGRSLIYFNENKKLRKKARILNGGIKSASVAEGIELYRNTILQVSNLFPSHIRMLEDDDVAFEIVDEFDEEDIRMKKNSLLYRLRYC